MKTDADYREQLREFGVKGEYIDAFAGPDLDRIGNLIGVFRSDPVALPKRVSDQALTFIPPAVIDYTNHRGERSIRVIGPVRVYYGTTTWHPNEQYLLEAWDLDKNAKRDFALTHIHSWRSPDAKQTMDEMVVTQLKRSMERNARMMNRLKRLAYIDPDRENLTALVNEIMNDREPTWQAA